MAFTRFRHRAMATLFEVTFPQFAGREAITFAETLFEEVDRVDHLLSRFDPTSEASRVNRSAFANPTRVEDELFQLLVMCQFYWRDLEGAFDPAGCRKGTHTHMGQVELDTPNRTVSFHHPHLQLDFGGLGKGYALSCCRKVLESLGVENYLIHGGTSSVLALGDGPEGEGWRIGIRNPTGVEGDAFWNVVCLRDRALSSSGVFHPGETESDLTDPRTQTSLKEALACSVIAEDPTIAEILSTSFLVLGRRGMEEYLVQSPEENLRVAWIEEIDSTQHLVWIEPEAMCA